MGAERVSVVIAVRDQAAYIGEALESVLAQDVRPLDVVVVDDGSRDGSAEVAAGFPEVRVFRQAPAGAGPARDRGVREATGALIAFQDADDRMPAGSLSVRLSKLAAEPGLELVYGLIREFSDRSVPLRPPAAAPIPGAILIRRAAFERSGGFGAGFAGADAVEWYSRVLDAGVTSAAVDAVVCERRVHAGQAARANPQDAYLKAVRAALERRRRPPGALP